MVSNVNPSQSGYPRLALYGQFLGSPRCTFHALRDFSCSPLGEERKYTTADLSSREIIKVNVCAAFYFLSFIVCIPFLSDKDISEASAKLKEYAQAKSSSSPPA